MTINDSKNEVILLVFVPDLEKLQLSPDEKLAQEQLSIRLIKSALQKTLFPICTK